MLHERVTAWRQLRRRRGESRGELGEVGGAGGGSLGANSQTQQLSEAETQETTVLEERSPFGFRCDLLAADLQNVCIGNTIPR